MRLSRLVHFLGCVVFLLGVSACTTTLPPSSLPPAPSTPLNSQTREARLAAFKNWHVQGKIALQTAQDAGTATVTWVQTGQTYAITLLGPLGMDGMRIHGQPGFVTLETGGKQFSANSAEALLHARWRFDVPVSNLYYWIRGLPAPGSNHVTYDSAGRIDTLQQQGWSIQYLGYTTQGDVDLPSKISFNSPNLHIKIVIYSWT